MSQIQTQSIALKETRTDLKWIEEFLEFAPLYRFYATMCGKTQSGIKIKVINAVINMITGGTVEFTSTELRGSPWVLISSETEDIVTMCVKQRAVVSQKVKQVSIRNRARSQRSDETTRLCSFENSLLSPAALVL